MLDKSSRILAEVSYIVHIVALKLRIFRRSIVLVAINSRERNDGQLLLQFLDACEKFGIVNVERSQNTYVGALVLRQPLDYRERPFYQLLLRASVSILSSLSRPLVLFPSLPLTFPQFED